jgi:hypothetical protein
MKSASATNSGVGSNDPTVNEQVKCAPCLTESEASGMMLEFAMPALLHEASAIAARARTMRSAASPRYPCEGNLVSASFAA